MDNLPFNNRYNINMDDPTATPGSSTSINGNAGNMLQPLISTNTNMHLDGSYLGFPPGFPFIYTIPSPSRNSTPYDSRTSMISSPPNMQDQYGWSRDQDLAGLAPHSAVSVPPLQAASARLPSQAPEINYDEHFVANTATNQRLDQGLTEILQAFLSSNAKGHENKYVTKNINSPNSVSIDSFDALKSDFCNPPHCKKQALSDAQNSFNRHSGDAYQLSQDQTSCSTSNLMFEGNTHTDPCKNQKVDEELQEHPAPGVLTNYAQEPHNDLLQVNADSIRTDGQIGHIFHRKLENTKGVDDGKICKCKKESCLQRYCSCFKRGGYCGEHCLCTECKNNSDYEDSVKAARKKAKKLNIKPNGGCNCRKSQCVKKYCECNQVSFGCSSSCGCQGCKNPFGRKEGNGEIIKVESTKDEGGSSSGGEERNVDGTPEATEVGGEEIERVSETRHACLL